MTDLIDIISGNLFWHENSAAHDQEKQYQVCWDLHYQINKWILDLENCVRNISNNIMIACIILFFFKEIKQWYECIHRRTLSD